MSSDKMTMNNKTMEQLREEYLKKEQERCLEGQKIHRKNDGSQDDYYLIERQNSFREGMYFGGRDAWNTRDKLDNEALKIQQELYDKLDSINNELNIKLKIAIDALKKYASLKGPAIHWPDHDEFYYLEDPALNALAQITKASQNKNELGDK